METVENPHREFAASLNGEVWTLLEKVGRTENENRRMVHAAHGSLYHWLHAGTLAHEQRGEWLVSHVYAELGFGTAALRHAERCAELTDRNPDQLQDFDLAYSAEGLARAHAALGNHTEAERFRTKARTLGEQIESSEDKKIFVGDLDGGNWHGLS